MDNTFKDYILSEKTVENIEDDFIELFSQFASYDTDVIDIFLDVTWQIIPAGFIDLGIDRAYKALLYGLAHVMISQDVQTTSKSTRGYFTTGDVLDNFLDLIAVDDGEFTISKDGGAEVNITAIDLTSATIFSEIATLIQTKISLAGVSGVTVTYDTTIDNFIFESSTSGATSSIEITAYAGVGTDLTGTSYLNGGTSTIGTATTPVTTSSLDDRLIASSGAGALSISYATLGVQGTMKEWEYFFGTTNYGKMLLLLMKNSGFGCSRGCYVI